MSTFPTLKTGAVAQYPAQRTVAYTTDTYRFLDGAQQKYREHGPKARSWAIELALLDDTELNELAEFFQEQQGRFGVFTFVDPWDGSVHSNCSFAADDLTLQLAAEGRGGIKLVIEENQS